MRAIAAEMERRREDFVDDLMLEQGKIRAHAEGEDDKAIAYFRDMAEWARRIEGEVIPSDRPGELLMLQREPIGVVAGICPWNCPVFLIARKVAPALITGCTVVLKAAEDTPLNAIMFAEVCRAAGLPNGVFNLVTGRGDVGAALSGHEDVDFVTFTGSTGTGSQIMESASKNVTKVPLELGGKAPATVLRDADVEVAAGAILASRILNNGQVCTCAERVYVERPIADAFLEAIRARFEPLVVADPREEGSADVGPLINRTAQENTNAFLTQAIEQGAQIVVGGSTEPPVAGGYFVQPTVLTLDDASATIFQDEVFGPILPVHIVDDAEEALRLANDSRYGLASSGYTRDLDAALSFIERLEFGEVYVNRENDEAIQGFHAGVKNSGISGADGKHAIEDCTTTKVSYIQRR